MSPRIAYESDGSTGGYLTRVIIGEDDEGDEAVGCEVRYLDAMGDPSWHSLNDDRGVISALGKAIVALDERRARLEVLNESLKHQIRELHCRDCTFLGDAPAMPCRDCDDGDRFERSRP